MSREWYQIQFQEKLDKLYSLRVKTTGSQLEKINETISILEPLIYCDSVFESVKKDGIYSILDYERDELISNRDFLHLLNPLIDGPFIPNKNTYKHFPKLSDDDLLELMNDFFKKQTNSKLYSLFLSMYKRKDSLVYMRKLRANKLFGEAIYLPYFREVHIRIKRYRNVLDVRNLAHEYGHGIQFLTNFHPELYSENSIFSEIVSIFFELLSFDYMRGVNEFRKASNQLEKHLYNDFKRGGSCLRVEYKLMMKWNELKSDIQKNPIAELKKELASLEDECAAELFEYDFDTLMNMNLSDYFIYLLGYIIAIEIFMVYIHDKDRGLWLLERLMKINLNMPKEEYFDNILKLGIKPNENLASYRGHIL